MVKWLWLKPIVEVTPPLPPPDPKKYNIQDLSMWDTVKGWFTSSESFDMERTSRLLRRGTKGINLYGSYLLTNPITAPFGLGSLGIGLLGNISAELIDTSSLDKSFRDSAIDVMTSSVPGGFAKDTIIDGYKEVLDYFAGD